MNDADESPALGRIDSWLRRRGVSITLSLLTGAFTGLVLFYALYRVEIPTNAFIYVAF